MNTSTLLLLGGAGLGLFLLMKQSSDLGTKETPGGSDFKLGLGLELNRIFGD